MNVLLSRGVSHYRPAGSYEVQGVGIGPAGLSDCLRRAGCIPLAVGVGSGYVTTLDSASEAPYGIQYGYPWEKARSMVNG